VNTPVQTVRITPDLQEAISTKARAEKVTKSDVIRQALRAYLEQPQHDTNKHTAPEQP